MNNRLLINIAKKYPNDQDLGKVIREMAEELDSKPILDEDVEVE